MSWWVVNQVSRPGGPRGPQQTNYVIEQAATRPVNTVAGPYSTRADAQAWQSTANSAGNSPGSAAGAAVNAVNNATGLTAISDFFSRLTQANTWIRVGEVLLGLALLSIGFARITGTTSAVEKLAAQVPGAIR